MNKFSKFQNRYFQFCIALIALILLLLACFPGCNSINNPKGKILFYGKGVVSYTKPDYSRYGSVSSGMYGNFVEFAKVFGFDSSIVKKLPENFKEIDILVITNIDHEFSQSDQHKIWNYVANGGNLWVLGDHTFIKNGENYVNELLAPTAIKLNHDSAQFFVQGWFNSYSFRSVVPFKNLPNDSENSLGLLVGASLSIEPPAVPIIIGKFAYSDKGTPKKQERREYLGDFKFHRNEKLGDLVLVAGQKYKKGKVLVFGDTSSFFNANTSKTYTLIRQCFSFFQSNNNILPFSGNGISSMLCLSILFLLILSIAYKTSKYSIMSISLLLVIVLYNQFTSNLLLFDADIAKRKLAIIDESHAPRISKHGTMPKALQGLNTNLMRYGLLPINMPSWDKEILANSRLLFIIAPQKEINSSEIKDINSFMSNGGTVIMTCSYQQSKSCKSLLDSLEIEILNIPLGRFFDKQAFGKPISFFTAWAVQHSKNIEIITPYDEKWSLVVSKPIGEGQFILIADSYFLHNINVEKKGHFDMNNINFIKNLLNYMKGKK